MDPLDPDAVPLPAFGLAEDYPKLDGDWHAHARPQLLYCTEGAMRLWTAERVAVLPPQRAAWIAGGAAHRVQTGRPLRLRTIYFAAEEAEDGPGVVVFPAPPLLREMARQACAWGTAPPPEMAPFFEAFLLLVRGWRASPLAVDLPAAQSPGLQRALDYLLARLEHPVGVAAAARAGGMSIRSFQRRSRQELGVSVQAWLLRARLLRALELLADREMPVAEVAMRCGYASHAAFTRVFTREMGAPPGEWRRASEEDS